MIASRCHVWLGLGAISLCVAAGALQAEDWFLLYDKDLKPLKVKVLNVRESAVEVKRHSDGREFEVPFARLSDQTVDELVEMRDGSGSGGGTGAGGSKKALDIPADLPKRFYPMSLSELDAGMEEILAREGQSGFEPNQVEGVNVLNVYRFLSGIPANVKLDRTKVSQAKDAANACQDHGSLSHDLGRSTDLCNLHQGQSSIAASVRGYIEDSGGNNREKRGHRMWCLNHPMGATGFGESENKGFYAMWAMDRGGKAAKEAWAYPGMGLYPLSHMHGNAWSLYLSESAPAARELKIEVYLLDERPEKPFTANTEIPGESLPVAFVYTYDHVINFEPTGKNFTKPGIYYVRIRGGGVREQYVVELIDR